MIFRTCRFGSTTLFPYIAAQLALSIFLPPETITFSRRLSRLETNLAIVASHLWLDSSLFQSLRNLRHGNRAFAADSPGIAVQLHDGGSQRPAGFAGVQYE